MVICVKQNPERIIATKNSKLFEICIDDADQNEEILNYIIKKFKVFKNNVDEIHSEYYKDKKAIFDMYNKKREIYFTLLDYEINEYNDEIYAYYREQNYTKKEKEFIKTVDNLKNNLFILEQKISNIDPLKNKFFCACRLELKNKEKQHGTFMATEYGKYKFMNSLDLKDFDAKIRDLGMYRKNNYFLDVLYRGVLFEVSMSYMILE